MALVLKDRVRETTTTTGTGTITLAGAVAGYQSFAQIGNANTTYYCIVDPSGAWEVGLGTYSTTGPTLARTTVLESSNAGALVSLGAGTKDVFCTLPAEIAAALPTTVGGTGQTAWTAGDVPYYSTGTALSKLAIGANTTILTSNGSSPTWTAASSVSVGSATTAGSATSATSATTAGAASNISGGAAGDIMYQSGIGTTSKISIAAANYVLTSSGTIPQWTSPAVFWASPSAIGATTPSTGAFTTLTASGNLTVATNVLWADSTNGLVRVGTTGGGTALRFVVNGHTTDGTSTAIRANDSAGTVLWYVGCDGQFVTSPTKSASPYLSAAPSSSKVAYISTSGVLCSDTATTASTGTAAVITTAGLVRQSSSSIRYKQDVQDLAEGLNEVLQLRSVTFRSNVQDDDQVRRWGGFIAEEVEQIPGLEAFVTYNGEGVIQSVAYGQMVALLVNAIKEQNTVIEDLKARVAALEAGA